MDNFMNYEKFEDFWKENQNDYIEFAKKIAEQDFNVLKNAKKAKFVCYINIDSDDDFSFIDKTFDFEVFGNSKKEILKNTIDFLMNLKLESYGNLQPYNLHKWEWLRDETIERLRNGETYISFGGNQQIDLSIYENKPITNLKKKF